jgi:23S rRNA (pseudouridine1915-N3)-methyltransferase
MSTGGLKLQSHIDEYKKRSKTYAKLNCINIIPKKAKESVAVLQEKDKIAILKHIPKQSLVYLCDEHGTMHTSTGLSQQIEKDFLLTSHITWVIGPAYGLSKALLAQHKTFSLSRMTLQHEIAHLVLIEQIYRALTIIHQHPYHR